MNQLNVLVVTNEFNGGMADDYGTRNHEDASRSPRPWSARQM